MKLRAGIPTIQEVEALTRDKLFEQHVAFNQAFLRTHGSALRKYGRHWGRDPLRLWSRRWEYPFAAQQVLDLAARAGARMTILDAGSGVTYFPYFLCDRLPEARAVCVDNDRSYHHQFRRINLNVPHDRVRFVEASLQDLPLEANSVDAICCISVLEHTSAYERILDEFARVLRPGGLLVLTFDLSLDGRFELAYPQARELLGAIGRRFRAPADFDPLAELQRMKTPAGLLSTDHVRRTEPELLPWRYPMLKGLHDLLLGKGWTGGFRSKSIYCMAVDAMERAS